MSVFSAEAGRLGLFHFDGESWHAIEESRAAQLAASNANAFLRNALHYVPDWDAEALASLERASFEDVTRIGDAPKRAPSVAGRVY